MFTNTHIQIQIYIYIYLFTYTCVCKKKRCIPENSIVCKISAVSGISAFWSKLCNIFCFRAFFRIGGAVCLGTVWFAEFAWRVSRKDAKMVVWQSGMSKGIQHDLKGCNCRLYRSQDAGIFLVVQITNPALDEALAGHVSSPTLVEIAKSP